MQALAARLLGPWVRRVDRRTLRADLLAGLLGAVLVLPQGIAFATLAGLPAAAIEPSDASSASDSALVGPDLTCQLDPNRAATAHGTIAV